ncbi:MAG TPA: PSD1 and planctomycete cytochrome C domain-containing protein [Pirellulales bacterium]|jgi:hypothetical protein|nr:PSD1 and planctomycete cytochrome C domain-containing protein [Pirellulales bacterium]
MISALIVLSIAAAVPADEAAAEKHFAAKVWPVFQAKCLACHGNNADDSNPEEPAGSLDLRTYDAVRRGGDSGQPALLAGKPDASLIYIAVTRENADLVMPPKENDKLSAEQVEAIRQWIDSGAIWPEPTRLAELVKEASWNATDGVTVSTSGGLSSDWTNRRYKPEDLWAYQPVRKPAIPANAGAGPIDTMLAADFTRMNITPAPAADRRTLVRRASFDLTGLPPTPEEIAAFVDDPASDDDAFAKLLDRLLASPHYGEQMARHWLDVVRYADSSGFANDYERGNTWRYRDWVVRAFNSDLPYDQFVRMQIAGDEIDPEDPEALVAVGFLRMGPWELTSMEVPKIARQRFLDDVTNSVGETFLAHSLQCARCHDHKFDPIPTRDYYSIQACFATTQLAERAAAFVAEENTAGFEEQRYLLSRKQRFEAELNELSQRSIAAARAWLAEKKIDPKAFDDALADVVTNPRHRRKANYEQARSLMLKRGVPEDQVPLRYAGLEPEQLGRDRIARKGLERLAWELERYEPFAFSVYDGRTPAVTAVSAPQRMAAHRMRQGELEETCILGGGDPFSPTQPVQPGVLSAVGIAPQAPLPPAIEGRRQALADWIADGRNPLTTRAIVNRVWLWHFGRALAGNPNNFGGTGKKPTHPELLDWLAAVLVERSWSLKALHREIMLSSAYRRGCDHPQRSQLAERDPQGTSYAVFRPRRLAAEELRDGMLLVSRELNPAVGGIPVRPEINLEAALQPRQVMGTFADAWTPSPRPEDRHRRSLYALKLRGLRDPFFEVFNEPNPDLSCEGREASTVTPQVFSLFNGQATYERAVALASQALAKAADDKAVLEFVWRRAYGRAPSEHESAAALAHWRRTTERHEKAVIEKPEYPSHVLREAVEENTGTKFAFHEQLDAYADFVPDRQLADLDPRGRGLAEVCLVIFNSNEFVYVY